MGSWFYLSNIVLPIKFLKKMNLSSAKLFLENFHIVHKNSNTTEINIF